MTSLLERPRSSQRPGAPPWVQLSPRAARRLRRLATGWLVLAVAAFAVLIWTRGIPRSPESGVMGRSLEVPIQATLLVLLVVGRLVAARWHRTGAVVIAGSAAVLGYLASVQHPPEIAAAVTLVTGLPAALLWLSWQRTASRRAVIELAGLTAGILAAVVTLASISYAGVFGPSHPESKTPAPSRELVDWAWAGAVTDSSFSVRVRTRRDAGRVVLRATPEGTSFGSARARASRPDVTGRGADGRVFSLRVEGLEPGTRYRWRIEADGRTDPRRVATLRTFPRGAASFTVAVGSCTLTGSNGAVFDAVRSVDPLLFVIDGDFLYANIDENDPQRFRDAYSASLRSPAQAALYDSAPIAYVWDDHDYSGNDGDRTATSRQAALQAYGETVPHYAFRLGPDGPVFQAFTIGRVRFLLTDNRSARSPLGEPDGPGKSMLGAEQRRLLLRELRDAGRYAAVVWVNPSPWLTPERAGADDWGGYAFERRTIADEIARAGVRNLVMLSGDAHMVAYDDGTNTDFSSTGGGGFPLLHAAALDRRGGVKGGPYSGGTHPGGGQFGTLTVEDDGASVRVRLAGYDWTGKELLSATVPLPRP